MCPVAATGAGPEIVRCRSNWLPTPSAHCAAVTSRRVKSNRTKTCRTERPRFNFDLKSKFIGKNCQLGLTTIWDSDRVAQGGFGARLQGNGRKDAKGFNSNGNSLLNPMNISHRGRWTTQPAVWPTLCVPRHPADHDAPTAGNVPPTKPRRTCSGAMSERTDRRPKPATLPVRNGPNGARRIQGPKGQAGMMTRGRQPQGQDGQASSSTCRTCRADQPWRT